jgi:uncharacterized protein YaeQ
MQAFRHHMAIKSTIYKANLSIANIDQGYYAEHALTLARHPSETDERMMVRLVALAMQAHQLQVLCNGDGVLAFGAGLSDTNEPDVWIKDFTDQIKVWIEVGLPEERPILKACGKSAKVFIYPYHHNTLIWYRGIENKIARLKNLEIYQIPAEQSQALALMAQRSMQLQATIQESSCLMSNGEQSVEITFERLF